MASYPIPHWIPGPQDVAGQFDRGAQLGMEQVRLRMESERMDRENILRQQELAQRTEYERAQLGMRQRELEEQQKLNQLRVQEQARLFQAQQGFQQWLAANPDKDPAEGILKFFPGTDAGSMAGYGTLARGMFEARQKLGPPEVVGVDVDGEKVNFLKMQERGGNYRMQQIHKGSQDIEGRQTREKQISILERRRENLAKSITDQERMAYDTGRTDSPYYKSAHAKEEALNKLDAEVERLIMIGGGVPTGAEAPGGDEPPVLQWNPQTQSWVGGAAKPAASAPAPAAASTPAAPSAFNPRMNPGLPSMGLSGMGPWVRPSVPAQPQAPMQQMPPTPQTQGQQFPQAPWNPPVPQSMGGAPAALPFPDWLTERMKQEALQGQQQQ